MKRLVALGVFLLTSSSLMGYQVTKAFFSDSAQSTNNTFSAASEFPLTTPLTSAMLKINEFSSDGGASGEWVEIYNSTTSIVNVSGWSITDNISTDVFPSVTPIPPGGFAVVVPTSSSVTVPGTAIQITLGTGNIGNGLADTGDRIILKNASSTEIDKVSYGTDAIVFPTPPAAPDSGESLSRSPNGVDTDSASDWAIDESPSIGVSN